MTVRLLFALATLSLVGTLPATAKDLPCECRDTFGNLHDVGTELCLTVDGRTFMALCAMSLNVTIWRDTGSDCPIG